MHQDNFQDQHVSNLILSINFAVIDIPQLQLSSIRSQVYQMSHKPTVFIQNDMDESDTQREVNSKINEIKCDIKIKADFDKMK